MGISEAVLDHHEPHNGNLNAKLNWLRAGVLGANDGIVSVAALLLGVIAAGSSNTAIFSAGIASTVAGAVSMALGEYVSVSAQHDSETMLIAKERRELAELPEAECAEMAQILTTYGISQATADQAAREISGGDPIRAHLRLELGIDSEDLTNPLHAAFSSATAFILGALLPLLAAWLAPQPALAVAIVTMLALLITGFVSAKLAQTSPLRSCLRLGIGGMAGLALTYGAGALFGAAA
ncbi:VIT1/CCC1 transporter family protein [Corynebacterium pseudopelargi]|uniref:VIT family protein n=1 Tax=Corynebacterium pseudopelargi TaxID=2080757 RepID=A0A3G6IRI8_9CORY|nr:VIT family protein [Corynebacterium pseudopelargi]AZA08201.1 VIT family protein [Corynebacterium pseudopelargi]